VDPTQSAAEERDLTTRLEQLSKLRATALNPRLHAGDRDADGLGILSGGESLQLDESDRFPTRRQQHRLKDERRSTSVKSIVRMSDNDLALVIVAYKARGSSAHKMRPQQRGRPCPNAGCCSAALELIVRIPDNIAGRHVTLRMVPMKTLHPRSAVGHLAAQLLGGITGAILANAMFDQLPLVM
jgi:hypothetical protein